MSHALPDEDLSIAVLSAALGRKPDAAWGGRIWVWRAPRSHRSSALRVDYWWFDVTFKDGLVCPGGSWTLSIGDPLNSGTIIAAPGFDDVMRKLQDPMILGRYSKKPR